MQSFSKFMLATGAAAAVTTSAMIPRPASANTTSTLLTAAAAIGAIVLYTNYQHKQAAANAIVGYTRNGGTVYGDGRVVMPNGQTYYPNSNGQSGYPGGYNQNSNGYGAVPPSDYNGNTGNNGYSNGDGGYYNGNAGYASGNAGYAGRSRAYANGRQVDTRRSNQRDDRGNRGG